MAQKAGLKVDLAAQPKAKTLEYRLCKKVAELTQVVHMLFTRNHEKEVELEAVKRAYEEEIERVIADAKTRLEESRKKIEELEKGLKSNSADNCKVQIETALKQHDEKWTVKYKSLQQQSEADAAEVVRLKSVLDSAQNELASMKTGRGSEIEHMSGDLTAKKDEIAMLKNKLHQTENELQECETSNLQMSSTLEEKSQTFRAELDLSHRNLQNVQKSNEGLTQRIKQLENELKIIRRELNRKSAQHIRPALASGFRKEDLLNGSNQDQGDELEKMRREIQRYRMELSNRENNFNRVFAEKQPTVVERRNMGRSLPAFHTAQGEVLVRFARERSGINLELGREKSMPLTATPAASPALRSYGEVQDPYENGLESRAPMTPIMRGNRQLLQSQRGPRSGRIQAIQTPVGDEAQTAGKIYKLSKPKPLPRELISHKNTH